MKKTWSFFFFYLILGLIGLKAQTGISGTVNDYDTLLTRGPWTCGDSLVVAGLMNYSDGDLLMFYNPRGASYDTSFSVNFGDSINLNNSGRYTFAYVSQSAASPLIILDRNIGNTFGPGTMIIKVPEYNFAEAIAPITVPSFQNGMGGIVVISAGRLRLTSNIDVSGEGFPGGFDTRNMGFACGSSAYRYPSGNDGGAPKGEGIGNLLSRMANGRGHFLNGGGGGNNHNAGGGGGGNGGPGGKGGDEWSGCSTSSSVGGLGGQATNNANQSRIYFGGGGGSGHNNVAGLSTEGGNGGGIVFLLCDTLEMNGGEIYADGLNGRDNTNGAEGAGGGGAGGTILLAVSAFTGNPVNAYARGGNGGDCNSGTAGPGGGGGGGVIWAPSPSLAIGVSIATAGSAGTLSNSTNYGSASGNNGLNKAINPINRPQSFGTGGAPGNFLRDDTLVCSVDSVLLEAPIGAAAYLWSTGDTVQSIYVIGAGTYWVQVTIGGCVYTDSVRITNFVGGSGSFLGPNQLLCAGDDITLSTSINGTYLWSDGSTGNSITISQGGWYWLDISTGAACPVRDSILITLDDFPNTAVRIDTTICLSDGFELEYPADLDPYWPNGTIGGAFRFNNPGVYNILVQNDNGCNRVDTLEIIAETQDTIENIFSISDTLVCREDGYTVNFSFLPGTVAWNDGRFDKIRTLYQGRQYIVNYQQGCLSTYDTLDLEVIDCDTCSFFMPNAFSPNGDGLNEVFLPISSCSLDSANFYIFDRWGELVFESDNPQLGWDGTFKGQNCMQGIYYYTLVYKLPYREEKRIQGMVYLRR